MTPAREAATGERWSRPLGFLVPVAVVAVGLIATALVVGYEQDVEQRELQEAAEEVADSVADRLAALLEIQIGGTGATAAALSVDPDLDRSTFDAYARSIEGQLPTLLGVGYVRRVATDEVGAFAEAARDGGAPDFELQDLSAGPEHAILLYNEPADTLRDSWGVDLRSVDAASAALDRSTDGGRTSVTDPVVLAVDRALPPGRQPVGYVTYAPVFRAGVETGTRTARRANVVGWANLPFRAQDLLGLVDVPPDVRVVLTDAGRTVAATGRVGGGEVATGRQAVSSPNADLDWTIDVLVPASAAQPGLDRSTTAGVLGVVLTVLLAALVGLVSRSSWLWAGKASHARRTLADSEARLRATIAAAPDLILVVDAGATVTSASPRARELLGAEPEDLEGRSVERVLPGVTADALDRRSDRVAVRADGTEVAVEVAGRRIRMDDPTSSRVVVIRDVTARRRAQEELRTRAEQLERSNRDLESAATIAAHDLSEPLTVIGGYADFLAQQYEEGSIVDEAAVGHLRTISTTVQRMRDMLQALLQMASLREDPAPPTEVDLADVVGRAAANTEVALDASDAELVVGSLPTVLGHRDLLVQLVQNLLSNAVRYRHPDRPLRISVDAERRGPWWCLEVSDNGIGVPPAQRRRIFQVFRRLDRGTPGLGVGLAVAQRIVELHGGDITVEDAPGGGATFVVRLPAEVEATMVRSSPP